MIFSENRFTLFRIMLESLRAGSAQRATKKRLRETDLPTHRDGGGELGRAFFWGTLMSEVDVHKTVERDPATSEQNTSMGTATAETPPVIMLPLVEYSVAAHRSGLGILRLGYLPAVPGPGLSEAEARKSISYIDLTLTEQACAVLGPLISELGQRLAEAKRRRS